MFLHKLMSCLRKSFHRRRPESIAVYLSFRRPWFITAVRVMFFLFAAKFMFLFRNFRVLNSAFWKARGGGG